MSLSTGFGFSSVPLPGALGSGRENWGFGLGFFLATRGFAAAGLCGRTGGRGGPLPEGAGALMVGSLSTKLVVSDKSEGQRPAVVS